MSNDRPAGTPDPRPVEHTARTGCPPWCTANNDCRIMHELVTGEFGGYPGPLSHVTVRQGQGKEPTVTLWAITDQKTEALDLPPADAALLGRVMSGVPAEDVTRFTAALAEAASVLGDKGEVRS